MLIDLEELINENTEDTYLDYENNYIKDFVINNHLKT